MFEFLTNKISGILDRLTGRGVLTEEDIEQTLRDIRIALLEADVALPAAKALMENVKKRAVGQETIRSIAPAQMVLKIIYEELLEFLGPASEGLNDKANSPFAYLIVGLQGSGKTTTAAKLAKQLSTHKKILLVSLDTYRPAAQTQLELLAEQIHVEALPIIENEKPLKITQRAFEYARSHNTDIILFDTAGRTHVDDDMMQELKDLHHHIQPLETLLVADALTGQDAVHIAESFKTAIPLTGLILTRMDGDARGGAALSMRYVTHCPIRFLGVGEHTDQLIPFSPTRIANQLLDQGDLLELVNQARSTIDETQVQHLEKRIRKGKFDLEDLQKQLEQMVKMGGMSKLLQFLPGAKKALHQIEGDKLSEGDNHIKRQIALIQSMTLKERRHPEILNGSRRKRIAAGAGATVTDLNRLIKQYDQIRKFMKQSTKQKPSALLSMLSRQ